MTKALIESEYRDQFGHLQKVPAETLRALDELFGPTQAKRDDGSLIILYEDELRLLLPESWRALGGQGWRLLLETGETREGNLATGSTEIACPAALPRGYHRLLLLEKTRTLAEADLVVAPRQAFLPDILKTGERLWGLTVQLYAVRSPRNWGIGDFTDLADLIGRAAAAGASLVGVNPLHALFPALPEQASPYSPSSRDFLNILYLDPEAIPDFAECEPARRLRQSPEFAERLESLRTSALVDYTGVTALKLTMFELLHRSFRTLHPDHDRDAHYDAFRAFRAQRGEPLQRFALFHALQESFLRDGKPADWRLWPAAFHDPESESVQEFAASNDVRIEFYEYLQWQATLQLSGCAARAQSASMPIGLYLDIAVGVDRNSAATWTNPAYWVSHWTIGAPPDAWNAKGQDWGLPAPDPARMRSHAYAGFRTMLRTNMAQAGAIRLDHILGLLRLFWVPEQGLPRDGAYVHYPVEELLSILALESVRHRCMVIGEDLGTVPDGFSAMLHAHGLLSYRLLYFERDAEGRIRPPESWERCAIAAITTHDLPTLAGYWHEADIGLKASLNLLSGPDAIAGERRERTATRETLRQAFHDSGFDDPDRSDVPVLAAHRFLAQTRSMIAVTQMEDLIGVSEQVNLPGTVDEHPNWRRKLPRDLPEIFADKAVQHILDALHKIRPSGAAREKPGAAPKDPLRVPRATYRLQFHSGFTFRDATALIPYLHRLGISHIYASPYLKARPGSAHGYDISDHNALNPEIGTPAEFDEFCDALRVHGMGQILDFVPNHMGIGKSDNSLWLDVLKWGRDSPFAEFFDIDWRPRQEALRGRILCPILGDHYGHVLKRNEIALRFDPATGSLDFWYADHCFPLHPRFYAEVLVPLNSERTSTLLDGFAALAIAPPQENATREQLQTLQSDLARLREEDPAIRAAIEAATARYEGAENDPASFRPLHELLEKQPYRLAYWRVAGDEINFRRFFDINELAGIRMERAEIFEHTHRMIGRLIGEGKLHGLRLDHLDGLYDPAAYLETLQRFAASQQLKDYEPGDPFYVVIEKILAAHESLRSDWPIAGATGYEFIALANGLQIDPAGEPILDRMVHALVPESLEEIVYESKKLVMETMLSSELNSLATALDLISEQHWDTRDYTWERLHAALREVVANFPVYRSYISDRGVSEEDRRDIGWAVAKARKRYTGPDPEIFNFVQAALTTDLLEQSPVYDRADVLRFAMRFQQYTGPVTAKAVEDTAFYRYTRLLSLNEVGGDPARFGTSPQAFHHAMQLRTKHWPHALNAGATHDTKRGEDARARLNVLSELGAEWETRVERWGALNRFRRYDLEDLTAPSPADEYMIYQMLVGSWPPDDPISEDTLAQFRCRAGEAVRKALREAKRITSWYNPNEAYESACLDFVDKILDIEKTNPFLDDFREFVAQIAPLGVLNSLSQIVLKHTVPGIPDAYQGTELWDHSFVDPDNRRPVDYAERTRRLAAAETFADDPHAYAQALAQWQDGTIKLAIQAALLKLRAEIPALFRDGSYEPLELRGARSVNALAFLRGRGQDRCVVVAGRLFASLAENAVPYSGLTAWGDTALILPQVERLRNIFTGEEIQVENEAAPVGLLLATLPAGVFRILP